MNDTGKADWVQAAMEQHAAPLTRYAASIVGDPDRARDVVQDTFVRLCAEDPGRLNGKLIEWLFTVCRNRALDVQRKERRMTALSQIDLDTRESEEPSPAQAAERRESASQVLDWLDSLPPNQREVIRLKFQNGLSYEEISRVTGHTATNVGFLIHTGMKTLRARMRTAMKEEA